MSYNGVGLQTARGTGTNGYIVRNLSHLRPRDGPPGGRPGDFGSSGGFSSDNGPPVHRQPDQGILDHEKKRKVEVRCLELRDQLEEKGVDEDTIETEVATLRSRLLAQSQASSHVDIRNLKSSDSHALAAAKQAEMNKMGRALGIGAGYVEGGAFSRKDAELERIERAQRREEAERKRAEEILQREQERERREAEFKEQERLRRRREYQARLDAEKAQAERSRPRSPPLPYGSPPRDARSPPRRYRNDDHYDRRRPARSPSPPRRRRDESRSPSPPRRRLPSRSPSPRGRSISRTPPRRGGRADSHSRSRSPRPVKRSRRDSPSRSPDSPPRRRRAASSSVSRSPPRRRRDSRSSTRSRSPVRRPTGRQMGSPSRSSPPRRNLRPASRSPSPRDRRNDNDDGKMRRGRSLSRSDTSLSSMSRSRSRSRSP